VIFLTACSEESFNDLENIEEESMYSTNSFNDDQPGFAFGDEDGTGTIWAGDNYASPWDLLIRSEEYKQPVYIIGNGNAENYSPYTIEVFAHVGLAYFDGVTDGVFNDPFTPNIFQLNNGLYPNLWDGVNEVGHLVRVPVSFGLNPGDPSIRLEAREDHLPIDYNNGSRSDPAFPPYNEVFDFAGTVTPDELDLLRQYGKVFFYEVTVSEAGTVIGDYLMHPNIETVQPGANIPTSLGGQWHEVPDFNSAPATGVAPNGNSYPLYFYWNQNHNAGTLFDIPSAGSIGTTLCDSREVVFQITQNMHSYRLPNGQDLKMYILQNSKYLWLNSALVVAVE